MKMISKSSFRPGELLLLVLELTLGVAGLVMISAALTGNPSKLYAPAKALSILLPASMSVGFACWLVFRLRCIGQARHRRTALLGAACLGLVAISFGAAVGKLAIICQTPGFRGVVQAAMDDPLQKEAGLVSFLAFMGIGLVFGVTFILRAGKTQWQQDVSCEFLHEKLNELGKHIIVDWNDQLVPQVDRLVQSNQPAAATELYCRVTGCTHDEAAQTIADWPEQRVRLEVELLSAQVQQSSVSDVKYQEEVNEIPDSSETDGPYDGRPGDGHVSDHFESAVSHQSDVARPESRA